MKSLGSKTLETNRLILHKTEEKDLKELWNILLLEEISKYYLTSKISDNWEEEKKWQYKKLERASLDTTYIWTIELKEEHTVIGQISIQDTEKEEVKDIGWFLDPMMQRKGYAYEAALEVLKYMFLEVEIKKIDTSAAIPNKPSWHLMEKLGFKRLKDLKQVKYTLLEDKIDCYHYVLKKEDFLKELFRKESLYISLDIDKDPYIKHITDDPILNITGESGSGKTEACKKYKQDENCIVIDTDQVFKEKEKDKQNQEVYDYLKKKYQVIPNLIEQFDQIYLDILEYAKTKNKFIIIDSAQFRNIKDVNILKGDIIVLRTSINTCFDRCIKRYQEKNKNASFEEISAYTARKKEMYKWYQKINELLDRLDHME